MFDSKVLSHILHHNYLYIKASKFLFVNIFSLTNCSIKLHLWDHHKWFIPIWKFYFKSFYSYFKIFILKYVFIIEKQIDIKIPNKCFLCKWEQDQRGMYVSTLNTSSHGSMSLSVLKINSQLRHTQTFFKTKYLLHLL